MKIAFLNLYSGVNNRGAETFIHGLAKNLSQNHKIIIFAGKNFEINKDVQIQTVISNHHQPQEENPKGIINFLRKKLFIDDASLSVLSFSLKVFPKLWSEKYDVIIPVNGFWQVLICKIATLFRGGKILITGHSGPGWDEKWNLFLHPNVFVATTKPTKIWAKSICSWTRVEVIPYGVDLEKFARAQGIKLNLEKPIFLCPAAAVPYKRIELAIRAVSKLEIGSLLHLGTGPEAEKLKKLGEELLGKDRFQSASVMLQEMPSYYAASTVVTLPSAPQENSPIVFLESLAAGKPLVVTDSARSRWILGDTASYVDPQNLEEYAQALKIASQNKDFKKILSQAQKYSWGKITKEYEDLLAHI